MHSVHTEHGFSQLSVHSSLPTINTSCHQISMGHPIESDHPLPVCRHFSSQRPAPAILSDTQEAVTRLVTLNTHPISNLGYSNIQNTNNATNTLYSHEKTSRSRNVNIPTFTGNSNDSWKVWFSRFSTVAERAHVHKQMLVKFLFSANTGIMAPQSTSSCSRPGDVGGPAI